MSGDRYDVDDGPESFLAARISMFTAWVAEHEADAAKKRESAADHDAQAAMLRRRIAAFQDALIALGEPSSAESAADDVPGMP